MNHPLRFDVFGRTVTVERAGEAWRVCYPGTDGTRRPADDIRLDPALRLPALPGALADLCHEWASPTRGEVRALLAPVFVYGTLKAGFPNAHRGVGERLDGTWTTVDAWPLMLCGPRCSPCLLDERGAGMPVHGEVYRVELEDLERLDALERTGEPDGYRRRLVRVRRDPGGDALEASVYLRPARHAPEPREGPFVEYTAEHASRYRSRESS